MSWHSTTVETTLDMLNSSRHGLLSSDVERRSQAYGPNVLDQGKRRSPVLMLLLQFKDVMILILLAAAVISSAIGDLQDAIVILVIVLLNAIVSFIQEYRAEKAIEALKQMAVSTAKVRRSDAIQQVSSTELVPGDIVLLEGGNMVPADIRLIDTFGLKIEEASLTGESHPTIKSTNTLPEGTVLADRTNMAYKSTLVTAGRGVGVVTSTGMRTEIGSIAQLLEQEKTRTPLQQRLADFSKKLSFIVIAICSVLYIVGLLRGEEPVRMLLVAISLAVAAIPEALPAVITIALALGAKKMVRQQALIRNLPAVETLGSVTYICSDKTGTLTQNRMTVKDVWVSPYGDTIGSLSKEQSLLLAILLNQDTKSHEDGTLSGDPTEIAGVRYVRQQGARDQHWESAFPRTHELPFDAERKMMTTVHRIDSGFLVITKGALESLLDILHRPSDVNITEAAAAMASTGQRILAYAFKTVPTVSDDPMHDELESGLSFLGLVGMLDPSRPEAIDAVAECRSAGIIPVMVTGDHPETAKATAKELGILTSPADRIISGADLAALDDETFTQEVLHYRVYARVSPVQKLRIVKTLQMREQFVAVTGDGVNDAPALKRANIGIAMGITGTDVSKEAADMILLDDNFATIVKAIKEGRRIFDNIRRFIKYVLTGNSAEIWTIFLAPLVGLPIPLLPIHILWINLVTDGLPGLALAGEQAEPGIMKRAPRRPTEGIFSGGLAVHIVWVGLLMAGLTLGTQSWAIESANTHWQTMVFTVLCFGQMAHVLAIRSEAPLLFRSRFLGNIPLIGAVLLTFGLQLAIIYLPQMNTVFSTHPLTMAELASCIAVSSLVFIAVELEKTLRNRKNQRWKVAPDEAT
jgi:Ca2+-transporting ATPase